MTSTVPQAFAASIERHAARTAVIGEDGQSLTYAQLDTRRTEAARALISLGIRHGDRIAIWAPNGVEWIIAGLAIHSVGAVLVPVNTRMKGSEAGYVLEKSGARLLFCAGSFLGQHYPTLLAAHRPKNLEHIVVMRDAQAGDFSWRDFLLHASEVSGTLVERRGLAVKPDDRMDIMFTSGTTGLPKGVVTIHSQNLRVIADWSRAMGLVPEDRYL
ncbi:MAG: AMP-binding protein, partial [Nevskiales bacterium]